MVGESIIASSMFTLVTLIKLNDKSMSIMLDIILCNWIGANIEFAIMTADFSGSVHRFNINFASIPSRARTVDGHYESIFYSLIYFCLNL